MGAASKFEPDFKPPAGAEINPYGIPLENMLSWKNAKNGFMVATCHYTTDPEKCGNEEWFREATRDMRPDQIRREMEISFTSRSGQKAFGYLLENPNRWRIKDMDLHAIPKNWRIIASLDYGTLNPTAIYFHAIDEHLRFRTLFEFYKPSNVREIASVLKGTHVGLNMDSVKTDYRHPLWKRCEKVVVDGAIFNRNQEIESGEGHRSVGDLLEEQGIYIMERATKDRIAGLERMHDMLAWKPDGKEIEPYWLITHRCHHLWDELINLVYAELPPHLLLNKNMKEDIVAKNDHAYDAARYSLMSIQAPSNEPPKPKPGDGTLGAAEKEMDIDEEDETDVDFF